ncbi:sulfonate ABC transporter ATP-binding protein [Candidatus Magnetomorum sp. HK-1]|nr:sulfonate ABC transporter ATP-binding protein [Candidatus Magnetomorum sp. HK-1]
MKLLIENIEKAFKHPDKTNVPVLKDVHIPVSDGSFVMILGESGCGKSTLLNIIAGIEAPTSGNVWVDNKKVTRPHPAISFLFQQPSLLPWLNVIDNIAFGCKLRGDTDDLSNRISYFVDLIGLSGFEKNYPSELSMGMACRVSLARALIGHPKILLLDEPFVSLDTFTRTRMQEELISIWEKEKFTVIFVTHDIDEAIIMGTNVVLLGGTPCSVRKMLEINAPYPRKIFDRQLSLKRTHIMMQLEKIYKKNRSNHHLSIEEGYDRFIRYKQA